MELWRELHTAGGERYSLHWLWVSPFRRYTAGPTNQNKTLQAEFITMLGQTVLVPVADRVLVADAILSESDHLPGYSHSENQCVTIPGGFEHKGVVYPNTSAHLKGALPIGGNEGYKDGRANWIKFIVMTLRTGSNTPYFWW